MDDCGVPVVRRALSPSHQAKATLRYRELGPGGQHPEAKRNRPCKSSLGYISATNNPRSRTILTPQDYRVCLLSNPGPWPARGLFASLHLTAPDQTPPVRRPQICLKIEVARKTLRRVFSPRIFA